MAPELLSVQVTVEALTGEADFDSKPSQHGRMVGGRPDAAEHPTGDTELNWSRFPAGQNYQGWVTFTVPYGPTEVFFTILGQRLAIFRHRSARHPLPQPIEIHRPVRRLGSTRLWRLCRQHDSVVLPALCRINSCADLLRSRWFSPGSDGRATSCSIAGCRGSRLPAAPTRCTRCPMARSVVPNRPAVSRNRPGGSPASRAEVRDGPGPVLVRPEDSVAELRDDVGGGAAEQRQPVPHRLLRSPPPMLTDAPQRTPPPHTSSLWTG